MWWWGLPGATAVQPAKPVSVGAIVDATAFEEARQKALLEKEIIEKGVGVCTHCEEEIWKNDSSSAAGYTWESEYLVGWCPVANGHRHSPKIEWKEIESD